MKHFLQQFAVCFHDGSATSRLSACPFINLFLTEFTDSLKALIKKGWESDSKGEICLKKKNNETTPFLLSFTSLELDEGKALSIILTDLTLQKETEKQLQLKNEQLEEARSHADKMNEKLEEIVKERNGNFL